MGTTVGTTVERFLVKNFGCRASQADGAAIEAGLAAKGLAAGDPRGHYRLIGAVWLDNPARDFAEDRAFADPLLEGQNRLSNTAMESFVQTDFPNCFACHNTLQRFAPKADLDPLPGKNVAISHVLNNLYFWLEQQAKLTAPQGPPAR